MHGDSMDDGDLSGFKRPLEQQSRGAGLVETGNKRRFIWPESLHRDFALAIFDAGLRQATAAQVADTLTARRIQCKPDVVARRLAQLAAYRVETSGLAAAGASSSSSRSSGGGAVLGDCREVPIAKGTALDTQTQQDIAQLRVTVQQMWRALHGQVTFVDTLKENTAKQAVIFSDLLKKLLLVDPDFAENGATSAPFDTLSSVPAWLDCQPLAPLLGSVPPDPPAGYAGHRPSSVQQRREPSSRLAGSGSTRKGSGPYLYDFPGQWGQGAAGAGGTGARAQLQLIADMRANMQVHRQLSSVMEEQVSLFGGLRPQRQQQGQPVHQQKHQHQHKQKHQHQQKQKHQQQAAGGGGGEGEGGGYLGAFGLEDYDAGDGATGGAGLGLSTFDVTSPAKMLEGWTDSDDFGLFAFLDGESINSPQPQGGDA